MSTSSTQRLNMVMALLSAVVATLFCMNAVVAAQAFYNQISDTPEYVVSAKLLASGRGAAVYDLGGMQAARKELFPQLRERGMGVFSPPPALSLMLPFALLPPNAVAIWAWLAAQLAFLSAACLMLQKTWPMAKEHWPWFWCWLIMFGPTYECLRIGQVTPFLLFALTVFLFLMRRGVAGVALAAFVLKPQEALTMGVYLLVRRYWTVLGVAVAVVLLLCGVALFLGGSGTYSAFFGMLGHLSEQAKWMQPEITPTVKGELLRVFGGDSQVASVLSVAVLGVALLFSAWVGMKREVEDDVKVIVTTILPVGLFSAMLCHTYDLMLLIPSVYCLAHWLRPLRTRQAMVAKVLLAVASIPFWLPVYAEANYGAIRETAWNPFFFALALFVVTAAWATLRVNAPARN